MTRLLLAVFAAYLLLAAPTHAQSTDAPPLQTVLQEHHELVERASRRTVQTVIDALIDAEIEGLPAFLERWQARELFMRDSDGIFVFVEDEDADPLVLIDIDSGAAIGTAGSRDLSQLRPNRGVQTVIGAALVQYQLRSDDPELRATALSAIDRAPAAEQIPMIAAMLAAEPNPDLRMQAQWLLTRMTIAYGDTDADRVAAIESLQGDLRVEARAALNPLLTTRRIVAEQLPEGANIARVLEPGSDGLSLDDAYSMLVDEGLAPPVITASDVRDALIANIDAGEVAGFPVHMLGTDAARAEAYEALIDAGLAEPFLSDSDRLALIESHTFYDRFDEPSSAVTDAATTTVRAINLRVGALEFVDLSLDGISLASIYFLAAIGLAITFGVMGVINMAHGEFIMMGAYTGYVVQTIVPDYTLSIVLALPLAFILTFGAGVAMERLVIRWLYARPLETLLATFGISIALQQIVRQVFGAQARPFTAPDWLAGSLVFNDVVAISYIRIAIFALGVMFFCLLWLILNKTRLGLEVRAVTQNPSMASSMGINPDRINMLTFGLGSGIAGIAGVAIGLFAQVTPELGANYIVQSFMTVVVGGVGNVFGALAGASLIGFLQKWIEWLNPSNTLAAQTYMILFVILFIQFRPKGIVALKGRAAEA
jgi:urea transport system permease protein